MLQMFFEGIAALDGGDGGNGALVNGRLLRFRSHCIAIISYDVWCRNRVWIPSYDI